MSADPSIAPSSSPEEQEHVNVQAMHSPIMRELAEPRDGYEAINPGWTIAFGVLLFWGGYYAAKRLLGAHAASAEKALQEPKSSANNR